MTIPTCLTRTPTEDRDEARARAKALTPNRAYWSVEAEELALSAIHAEQALLVYGVADLVADDDALAHRAASLCRAECEIRVLPLDERTDLLHATRLLVKIAWDEQQRRAAVAQ